MNTNREKIIRQKEKYNQSYVTQLTLYIGADFFSTSMQSVKFKVWILDLFSKLAYLRIMPYTVNWYCVCKEYS